VGHEEIREEIKKFLALNKNESTDYQELNKNESTDYQNLWDTAKAVLWGKCIAMSAYKKSRKISNK
jgi:hypothetical protein